jgi:DNA-binding transcriptional LysR family regulator
MLTELKTLIAIKKYGSFSATGKEIGLTQAAVSAQIKSLELYLGSKLFDRVGRNVHLNAEGLRVINLAEEMMTLAEKMKFPPSLTEFSGEIQVGAISTIQVSFLPQLLKKMITYFPNARINLVPGISEYLLESVMENRLDIAFIIKPPFALDETIESYTLKKEEFLLITHQSVDESHIREILEKYPFIRYNYKSFGGVLVQDFIHHYKLNTKDLIEVDDIEAIVKMVESNLGIAIIPDVGLWKERPAQVKIFKLNNELQFFREIIVIHKKYEHQFIAKKIVKDLIQDQYTLF